MLFEKDNIIRDFTISNGKVKTYINVGCVCIVNPSIALFKEQGWVEVIVEPMENVEPQVYIPTRDELIENYIREHGYPTYGAELAVINNYAENPTEYADDYATYHSIRIAAKEYADNYNK